MSHDKRLDLSIDIFEIKGETAQALPSLTPPEFVDAILQEFRDLEYLSNDSNDYQLVLREKEFPRLKNEMRLDQQPLGKGHLILVEKTPRKLPAGTQRPATPVYLREQTTGKVYKLHYLPAIIGRPDKNQQHNDRIAINMDAYESGLRVSRRHAMITEENGEYYIKSMSRNPTFIKDVNGKARPVSTKKQRLQQGEIIYLERSNISLKLIIRTS